MAFNFNKTSNPIFSDRLFKKTTQIYSNDTMTVSGTVQKFGFLFLMLAGAASFSWNLHASGQLSTLKILMYGGLFAGLGLALVMAFKPNISHILAPLYALAEGFFLGGISAIINNAFYETAGNLVLQAVVLTFGVVLAMLGLYAFRIIKVTDKLRSGILMATFGVLIFYGLSFLLRLFGINIPGIFSNGTLGLIVSGVVITIAALNLLLDFDRIENFSKQNAPKFMEWFSAFGLLVTIVWLYIEILRLLSIIASNRD